MSLIEFILIVAVLLAGFIAIQAHKNSTTFKAQAKTDLDKVEADLSADLAAFKAKVAAKEAAAKLAATPPAPQAEKPVAPVTVQQGPPTA
jgi:hypothetical protein